MLLTLMPGWRDFTRDLPLNHIRMKAGPGILEGKREFLVLRVWKREASLGGGEVGPDSRGR